MANVKISAALPAFLANVTRTLVQRANSLQNRLDGPRRDIDEECQYPKVIDITMYKDMYEREGYGKKAVETLPLETWKTRPDVYENQRKRFTPYEKAVETLNQSELAPLTMLKELDIRCGIGCYGGMLIGVNDGLPLDAPAAGVGPDGFPDGNTPPDMRLNSLTVYDESELTILEQENNPANPRFRQPTFYQINEVDRRDPAVFGPTIKHTRVHWSRVLHAADNCPPNAVYGQPRQKPLFNRLLDLRKILGGDGEMFWKGGFPGLVATADPSLLEAGATIEIDEDALKEQLRLYMDGLQRYLTLVGMQVTALSPQVADPTPHVLVHLNAIACALNMPLRIFLGSEEGKLAGGHDKKNWEGRIKLRQQDFATPCLVRPFYNRAIMMGVVPPPKEIDPKSRRHKYTVEWPPVEMPDDDVVSTVADRTAAAIQKFVVSGAFKGMQWSDFMRFVLKWEQDVIDEVVKNAKKPPEVTFPDPNAAPGGDTGVAGKPPSDPKPVTVK